jgi:hypothetical protein
MVGSGIDQEHAEQHDVTSDSTDLSVVDLDSGFLPDLSPLNVEKAAFVNEGHLLMNGNLLDVMSRCMDY